MMRLKPAAYHPGVDVAAEAQLQPQAPGVPDDLPLDPVADVYDVADAGGPPAPQEHQQLLVGAARLGLGEVQRDPQPGAAAPLLRRLRFRPARLLERRLQGRDAAPRRVPAQVDAHDAPGALLEGAGQADDLEGLARGVAPVDREDEPRVEGRARGGGLEGADDVQDGGDVALLGEAGPGQRPRRRAQLEVDDAVPREVAEDGEGGVLEGREVVDEVVDVGGEEGEEAWKRRGELGVWAGWTEDREQEGGVTGSSGPSASYLRFQIIVVLAIGHLYERVGEVCLPGLLFHEPDFVKTLPADATT